MAKIPVGIVGARGYTARELLVRLIHHPEVEVVCLMDLLDQPVAVSTFHPSLRGLCDLPVVGADGKRLAQQCQIVFLCLPHGPAAKYAEGLAAQGRRVIDFSADFRFADQADYEKIYGQSHGAPALLGQAVYGLPELWRERIRSARIVGNPGCYPTAVLMALAPLARTYPKGVPAAGIVADCKSGVSGAGRTPSEVTHFAEANESLMPYKVASHRHSPEIDEQLSTWVGVARHVTFVPHLVPMDRGICATVHVPWQGEMPPLEEVHGALAEFCRGEPFLRLLPPGQTVNTKAVAHTNLVDIALAADRRANLLIVMTAIDNLVKGASGQAIQNMNLLIGCEETTALL